jgi:hypothetical protein
MRLTEAEYKKLTDDRAQAVKAAHIFTPETPAKRTTSAPRITGQMKAGRLLGLKLMLPIKTVSEANQRDHWRTKNTRKRDQQEELAIEWQRLVPKLEIGLPCVVKLTRIGQRELDGDNLQGAFKGIRDQIAKTLGVDDGSELIDWQYGQAPAFAARFYGVEIEIQAR